MKKRANIFTRRGSWRGTQRRKDSWSSAGTPVRSQRRGEGRASHRDFDEVLGTCGCDQPRRKGRKSVATVPFPTLLRTVNLPLCLATIPFVIQRPRPLPPCPLVVKNGSNRRSKTSLRMPDPVSATVITSPFRPVVQSVAFRERRRSRPPLG